MDESITFKGWVARDDVSDRYYPRTFLFCKKPRRDRNIFSDPSTWRDTDGNGKLGSYELKKLFPKLKFSDEPIEVEITIKPIIKS